MRATRGSIVTRKRILQDFLYGVILSFALTGAAWLTRRYPLVERIRYATYEWLQSRLVPADRLLVTVIDIGELKPQRLSPGDATEATPRGLLMNLIDATVSQAPKAIGIDIDFGPEAGRYITPDDPIFFLFCKQKRVPVFLGVYRSQGLRYALLQPQFQDLAASLLNPNEPSRAVEALSYGAQTLRTMPAALADAYGRRPSKRPFLEEIEEKQIANGVKARELLVDFSPLEKIQEERTIPLSRDVLQRPQRIADVIASHRNMLAGRMVLIGDATTSEGADRFVVPGRDIPVPGVYVLACATYTLAGAPLYQLAEPWRALLDALIATTILVVVLAVRRRSTAKDVIEREERLTKALIVAAVFVLFTVGGLLVRWTRVVWDDLLIVCLILILHRSFEHWVSHLLKRLRPTETHGRKHKSKIFRRGLS